MDCKRHALIANPRVSRAGFEHESNACEPGTLPLRSSRDPPFHSGRNIPRGRSGVGDSPGGGGHGHVEAESHLENGQEFVTKLFGM